MTNHTHGACQAVYGPPEAPGGGPLALPRATHPTRNSPRDYSLTMWALLSHSVECLTGREFTWRA